MSQRSAWIRPSKHPKVANAVARPQAFIGVSSARMVTLNDPRSGQVRGYSVKIPLTTLSSRLRKTAFSFEFRL
jgi:hypothetical protein